MTLAGLASFSVMDGTMKAAALALGAFAAIFWRSTVGALAIAPLWLRETVTQRGGRLPPHAALRVHVLRGWFRRPWRSCSSMAWCACRWRKAWRCRSLPR
jgi:hypothetical protein